MAGLAPYTYIQCPCSDPSTLGRAPETSTPRGSEGDGGGDDEDDDRTFDPRAPRSNYSLYPLEYLLYCEDCHQIRCPRCIAEEIVTYFCPSCLFEVPSSNIKSEGTRCTRSCVQCPICPGTLSVSAEHSSSSSSSRPPADGTVAPANSYILTCSYCNWSSREIGIHFEKSNSIYSQLQKIRNGGRPRLTPKERKERRKEFAALASSKPLVGPADTSPQDDNAAANGKDGGGGAEDENDDGNGRMDAETHYANLKSFYQSQLADTDLSSNHGLLGDLGFNSPGSLSRIMNLYTGGTSMADKRRKARVGTMREALDPDEGLSVLRTAAPDETRSNGHNNGSSNGNGSKKSKPPSKTGDGLDEGEAIARLRKLGWEGTTTAEQRSRQAPNPGAYGPHVAGPSVRAQDDLRPVPFLLRTKRSKRCPMCRHIMTKPESKVSSNRFRIRLVARNYIPTISVRFLGSGGSGAGGSTTGISSISNGGLLAPLEPVQYLLTFKNPIFEPVRVSLATPSTTPGRFASTVTLLCPQFEIGANTDVWDEALKDGSKGDGQRTPHRDADGSAGAGGGGAGGAAGPSSQAEAGKIWERGRNWVSIVVEVVPASLRPDLIGIGMPADKVDRSPLKPDEDLLEIPMFVRVEWEAEPANDGAVGQTVGRDRDSKEKRELAYWCVVGIGRIRQQ
ncbi:hypothetical protein RB595_000360 [Gaeumannomyces hyphopodioides]